MKRATSRILMLGILASALTLTGCPTVTYPTAGMWSQNIRVPLDGKITSGSKEGKACVTSYFGVYAAGDASVETAAANGGITHVKSVEALVNSKIVIGTFCTVVHGS